MAHVRIGIYKRLGDATEIMKRGREGLLPIYQKQHGFIDYELVDAGDLVVSISHWETADAASDAADKAADWVRENIGEMAKLQQNVIGQVGMSSKGEPMAAAD